MSNAHNAFLSQQVRSTSETGLLAGKSIAVKDNISTKGIPTTCGSAMLEEYIPPYDATVVERVLDAGGTLVGKTNMDEFGMGSTTETSAFGPTTNPVDEAYVPGGSSGGSAAAVASGEADIALGTDTGGSVRNPAAFCGVVGLKPTYGLVSRYGLIAYAHSLEQIGPIGSSVDDVALLLDVIAGPDERDATCRRDTPDDPYRTAVGGDVSDMTIGIPPSLLDGAESDVLSAFHDAIEAYESMGITTTEIELPALDHAVAAYYVLAMAEASSNLARYDGVRYGKEVSADTAWNEAFANVRSEGFGDEVTRRILLGTFALSAGYHDHYYEKAQSARSWITTQFNEAFAEVDVIASPTMPVTAFPLGETIADPLRLYLADANTVPVNLANVPAISVPIGTADGLPVGAQLITPRYQERRLLRAASALERSCC